MSAASYCLLTLAWSLPPQEAAGDQHMETLIRQLDGLGESAPGETFLQRPALMELIAQFDRSAPALLRALQDSNTSLSVKAGAAYVLIVNKLQYRSPDIDLHAHLNSSSLLLRTIAAHGVRLGDPLNERVSKLLAQPESQALANVLFRIPSELRNPTEWLPDDYLRRRTERVIQLTGNVREFEGDRPGFEQLTSTLSTTEDMSWLRGMVWESIRESRQGHVGASLLLERLRTLDGSDVNRLSSLFALTSSIPGHRDASHAKGGACPLEGRLDRELLALVGRHVWTARDPQLLEHMINRLEDLGDVDSLALLDRLAKEHPLEGAREWAALTLRNIHAMRAKSEELEKWSAGALEAQARELEARRARSRPLSPASAPPPGASAPVPAKPPPGPLTEPPGKPWTLGICLGIGFCFILFRMFRKANP